MSGGDGMVDSSPEFECCITFSWLGWEYPGKTYAKVSELAAVFNNTNLDDAFQNPDEAQAFWFREEGQKIVSAFAM
jgi:hypothetical protein